MKILCIIKFFIHVLEKSKLNLIVEHFINLLNLDKKPNQLSPWGFFCCLLLLNLDKTLT